MLASSITAPQQRQGGRIVDKQAVATSFSRAAGSYDQVATIQRWMIAQLMEQLGAVGPFERVLDIGCGTGYLMTQISQHFQPTQVLGLDIAEGMTRVARARTGHATVCGDAEAMPLPDTRFDLLVSSFALQWCPDLAQVFSESHRVLQSGGSFYFTLPVTGTLAELKDCWQQADPDNSHVNDFYSREELMQAARAAGFRSVQLKVIERCEYYPDLKAITGALKAMGAHNVTAGRARQLTGKQKLRALMGSYESYRTRDGLPLSWQVAFGVLEK